MQGLATKHNDPNARLGWGERLGYGSGQLGMNAINAVIGSFLTIYFTNAALLDAGIIASIIAVSKVFDGISDLIMGNIVDRTKSRFGKARVWLMRMCIPFAVTTVLLFTVPSNWPEMAKYVYVFIFYNLVNTVCFTSMAVPYYSMISLMTKNAYERGMLGNVQQIFQTLANVIINSVFIAMLTAFTDNAENIYTQRAFTLTMIVISVAMVILSLICLFSTKERVKDEASENAAEGKKENAANPIAAFKALIKNRYWVTMIFANFVIFFVVIMYSVGNVYYCQYIYGDMSWYGWMSNAISIAQFAIMFITPYSRLKSGIDPVGMGNAAMSASQKLGLGIGTAVLGWVMDAAGFDASLDVQGIAQPDSVITAIQFLYNWIPVIMCAIVFIALVVLYDIEKKLPEMEKAAK